MSTRPDRARGSAVSGPARAHGIPALLAALVLVLSACAPPAPPVVEETPTPTATPGPVTLRTLIDLPPESPTLETVGAVQPVADETATEVAYTSGGLRVTGVLRVPQGDGPFPAVVVVHGSSDPEKYETGRDLFAEQQALVWSGYTVLAVDMRGYADSDAADTENSVAVDPGFGWLTVLDWGMALDVVNALRLLRNGEVRQVDPDRIGLVGHSLGGLLALDAAVIAPEASDIVVALAAAPSDFAQALADIERENPGALDEYVDVDDPATKQYWADVSPSTFFDRVDEPLLMIHGSADDTASPEWSAQTVAAWKATGNPAELLIVDGGDHLFKTGREEEVGIMVAALDAALKQASAK